MLNAILFKAIQLKLLRTNPELHDVHRFGLVKQFAQFLLQERHIPTI